MKTLAQASILLSFLFFGFFLKNTSETHIEKGKLEKIGSLTGEITESSGLAMGDEKNTLFTHNDTGGAAELYKIGLDGTLQQKIDIHGAENIDWEDLAQDRKGYIFICDTGNNQNKRNNFSIFKVKPSEPSNVENIEFTYADQDKEEKGKKELKAGPSYDCEAVVWSKGQLYLFTKSQQGQKANTRLYAVQARAGKQVAKHISTRNVSGHITAADLSPDGNTLALLCAGKLLLYEVNGDVAGFKNAKERIIDLGNTEQAEGITFADNRTIYISNEREDLFRLRL